MGIGTPILPLGSGGHTLRQSATNEGGFQLRTSKQWEGLSNCMGCAGVMSSSTSAPAETAVAAKSASHPLLTSAHLSAVTETETHTA